MIGTATSKLLIMEAFVPGFNISPDLPDCRPLGDLHYGLACVTHSLSLFGHIYLLFVRVPCPLLCCKSLADLCFTIAAPYYMLTFMWSIGLVNTITQFETPAPYSFSSTAIALFYFAPIIGSVVGDLWGHFFNDFLSNRYIRKHDGLYEPEARLWAIWPATFFAAGSLVLIGQVLQHGLSWVGLAFGWGMFSMAVLAATVAISAYVLDCFPHHAAQAASIVNFWRTTGGFCVVYFQSDWVARSGAGVTFGCQAAICVFAFLFVVMAQICGRGWRVRFPPPSPEN